MNLVVEFTFSKILGERLPDEKVEMHLRTAEVIKAKGYGDFKFLEKFNMSLEKDIEDKTEEKGKMSAILTKAKKQSAARVQHMIDSSKDRRGNRIKDLQAEIERLKSIGAKGSTIEPTTVK